MHPSRESNASTRSSTSSSSSIARKSSSIPRRTPGTQFKPKPLSTTNSNARPVSNSSAKPKSGSAVDVRKRKIETEYPRNTLRPKISQEPKTVSKRPAWDIKGKMSDMENQISASQARVEEVKKSWQDLEDAVANKETESRLNNQRLMEIQTEEEVAKRRHAEEMEKLKDQHYLQNYALQQETAEIKKRAIEMQNEYSEIQRRISELEQKLQREDMENRSLQTTISQTSASFMEAEAELHTMKLRVEQADASLSETQQKINDLKAELDTVRNETKDMETELLQGEKTRRWLHNTIQELKGNIRVFCRVRPPLESEKNLAQMRFYGEDREKLELSEEISSTLGRTTIKTYPFSFDKVFPPHCTQQDCYEEISQLVQSALDGYNVCIFAYGQTGSGKTYTMQGPPGPHNKESAGMIPRAVQQIYDVAQKLSERNWKYSMEGQFLEIYNETVHDLLGDTSSYGKIKHEIRHDKHGRTTVTDVTTVVLDSPSKVNSMLRKASHNRATGATNLNERSSRSHSVFMLRLTGSNAVTGEHCSGVLNLIDLAGSERLALSGSTGDRLRETQAINKSLSCLGDVIHALASNNKDTGHVPYRNSKLTYLLQNSLGGNSKTLMFVNISPLSEHFGETLCSLRFATKVNSCRIGTAKRNVNRQ